MKIENSKLKIYLGADHRGFELKEKVKSWLSELGYEYDDVGALAYNKDDDYPDFAKLVAENVTQNPEARGILICGSGVGVAVAANKIKGIRAGTAINAKQITDSVNDEDLNVLALSADHTQESEVRNIVKEFLEAKFSGENRHIYRINKLDNV